MVLCNPATLELTILLYQLPKCRDGWFCCCAEQTSALIMAQMLSHHDSGALRPNHFLKISSFNTLKIKIWKSYYDS